jgi:hypothetical protein
MRDNGGFMPLTLYATRARLRFVFTFDREFRRH